MAKKGAVVEQSQEKKSDMNLLDLRGSIVKLPNEVGSLTKHITWVEGRKGEIDASYLNIEYPTKGIKLVIGCKNNNMWVGVAPIAPKTPDVVEL